jgi:hypothetical protein
MEKELLAEIKKLREEVAALRAELAYVKGIAERIPNIPIPGKRCTIHANCSGGSQYCNDGGPVTDHGIGW